MTDVKGKAVQKDSSSEKSDTKPVSDYVFAPLEGLNFREDSFSVDIVPSSRKDEDGKYVRDPTQPPIVFLKLGFRKDKDGNPVTIVGPAFAVCKICVAIAKAVKENKSGLRDDLDLAADWINSSKKETTRISP